EGSDRIGIRRAELAEGIGILAAAAGNQVIAGPGLEPVVAAVAVDGVVAAAAGDRVVAAVAREEVVAAEPADGVGIRAAADAVVALGAVERRHVRSPRGRAPRPGRRLVWLPRVARRRRQRRP